MERLSWTYQHWLEYLDCPKIQAWVVYVSGTPAGYIELQYNKNNNVKIVYFGILPQFLGQHIGGHLLSFGVQQAWTAGVKQV
ncbi:MAG: GNAT family N-acetyltransferase [Rhizonema sp. PD37]|nr:GNAT family N-acetyltransferase [Rhizonema sp. PD37]